jgi:hypothetical protein
VKESWRKEHNEKVFDMKVLADSRRQKRAWVKINFAIEQEEEGMLAKLEELDAKNPDNMKVLPAATIEDDIDDDDEDEDEDDIDDNDIDDEKVDESEVKIPIKSGVIKAPSDELII